MTTWTWTIDWTDQLRALFGDDVLGYPVVTASTETKARFKTLLRAHGFASGPAAGDLREERNLPALPSEVLFVRPDTLQYRDHPLKAWPRGASSDISVGQKSPFAVHLSVPATPEMLRAVDAPDGVDRVRASANVTSRDEFALALEAAGVTRAEDYYRTLRDVTFFGQSDFPLDLPTGVVHLSRLDPVGLVPFPA